MAPSAVDSFVIDLRYGLAFFSGGREAMRDLAARLGKKSRGMGPEVYESFESRIRQVCIPEDIDESEAEYMLKRRCVPRRVQIRIRKKDSSV